MHVFLLPVDLGRQVLILGRRHVQHADVRTGTALAAVRRVCRFYVRRRPNRIKAAGKFPVAAVLDHRTAQFGLQRMDLAHVPQHFFIIFQQRLELCFLLRFMVKILPVRRFINRRVMILPAVKPGRPCQTYKHNSQKTRQRHSFFPGYGKNFFLPVVPGNDQLNHRLRIHFFQFVIFFHALTSMIKIMQRFHPFSAKPVYAKPLTILCQRIIP